MATAKKPGRPKKPNGTKAVRISTTVTIDEAAYLEWFPGSGKNASTGAKMLIQQAAAVNLKFRK